MIAGREITAVHQRYAHSAKVIRLDRTELGRRPGWFRNGASVDGKTSVSFVSAKGQRRDSARRKDAWAGTGSGDDLPKELEIVGRRISSRRLQTKGKGLSVIETGVHPLEAQETHSKIGRAHV